MQIDIEKAVSGTDYFKQHFVAYDAYWRIMRFWREQKRWPQKHEMAKLLGPGHTAASAEMVLRCLKKFCAVTVDEKTNEVRPFRTFKVEDPPPLLVGPAASEAPDDNAYAA